jgi:hypothetical protein
MPARTGGSGYTVECAQDVMARAGLHAMSVWLGEKRVCTVAMEWRPLKG